MRNRMYGGVRAMGGKPPRLLDWKQKWTKVIQCGLSAIAAHTVNMGITCNG